MTDILRFGVDQKDAPSVARRFPSIAFVRRMLILGLLFSAELIVVKILWRSASLVQHTGLVGFIYNWGALSLQYIVAFSAIFMTFVCVRNKAAIDKISAQLEHIPVGQSLLAAHCAAMIIFGMLSFLIDAVGGLGWPNLLAASWFVAGVSAIIFAGLAFLPGTLWAQLVHGGGYRWIYALLAVLSARVAVNISQSVWSSQHYLSLLTLGLAKVFLTPFVSDIVAKPEAMVLGTQRFSVLIGSPCSGVEGIGLILVFGILWLLAFKRECRFPQSFVLIPLGIVLMFVLNAARLAVLVLIGNAGATRTALDGFHSQAGWIAFSVVAVGFCCAIQQVPWFTTTQRNCGLFVGTTTNPTAAFLLPFMMVLAAGVVARAFGSSEWLYSLGFVAAAVMLWLFRSSYAGLGWGCDWFAAAIGTLVFATWLVLGLLLHSRADIGHLDSLLASATFANAPSVIVPLLAGVMVIPVAEELAFRGFLMRRLISVQFESLSFEHVTWLALLISSIGFGLLQGEKWLSGAVAGILFALAALRRGRIGDAVVAHATANTLLILYILVHHNRFI